MKIKRIDFEGYYVRQSTEKKQIVLHHTVSDGSAQDVADYWKRLKNASGNYVATHFVLDQEGTFHQLFNLDNWAGHVGDCSRSCKKLNLPNIGYSKNSVGIEIISLGGLKKGNDGKLYDAYGRPFKGRVAEMSTYRGYNFFHQYTLAQVEALGEFLPELVNKLSIKHTYRKSMWDINSYALMGEEGIYSHTSYRLDKSDIYPDPRIIQILQDISVNK